MRFRLERFHIPQQLEVPLLSGFWYKALIVELSVRVCRVFGWSWLLRDLLRRPKTMFFCCKAVALTSPPATGAPIKQARFGLFKGFRPGGAPVDEGDAQLIVQVFPASQTHLK